jgi:DNA adenine methylase
MKSPLRYPGGKSRAIKIIEKYIPNGKKLIISPFFGGGSFELYMASKGYNVLANDLFYPLVIFWNIVKTSKYDLEKRIRSHIPVTKEKFKHLRSTINEMTDVIDIAAAYYIINRCSFSGSTFCGGFSQAASDGRLTDSIISNMMKLDLDNIIFSNVDCCEFLDNIHHTDDSIVYADPPYYIKTYIYGRDGDLHESFNHEKFALTMKNLKCDWVMSYNDCEYIRELYKDYEIIKENWSYGMNTSKKSSEIIIRSKKNCS